MRLSAAVEIPRRLDDQVELFVSTLSTNSVRAYRRAWRHWREFTGSDAKILAATSLHVQAYLKRRQGHDGTTGRDPLSDRRLSGATLSAEFWILKSIYDAIICAGHEIKNPFAALKPPSPTLNQKRPTEMTEYARVRELLEAPRADTKAGVRDRAMLALLFGGALRRSEVAALRVGDIGRAADGTLRARLRGTKAGTDVDQALPNWTAPALTALVTQRKGEDAQPRAPLLINYRGFEERPGAQISDSTIYRTFKRYARAVGLPDSITPHSARATAVTRLLDLNKSHREVREFSRHRSVTTVETYDKRRHGLADSPAHDLNYDAENKKSLA